MPDVNQWEEELIADLRANGGRPSGGPLAGQPLMLMFSTGARSGLRRRSILTYTRDGEDYIIAGTNSGRATHPAWLANIEADPSVTLEVDNETLTATAHVTTGDERARLWEQHVAALPWFGEYPEQVGGREIPVIRLVPDHNGIG
jgi:deazaflavin-dependent oxidoreductase (nitroreductase family)